MAKLNIVIAGHGKLKNGGFDSGATGYIKQGEHRYMTDLFIPSLKKFQPRDVETIYITDYNVYDYRNILDIANKYGKNKVSMTELHFDATGNNKASGGHVIIHKDYKPDKQDVELRNAIESNVGLFSYSHRGYRGISGRSDLYNCNVCRNNGVTYRLLELGFGTNKKDSDYLLKNYEPYAKDVGLALWGRTDVAKGTKGTKGTTLHRVQVGAFKVQQNAINLRDKLRKQGYKDAFIKQENGLYKVQVGAYSNLDNAKNKQNELIKKGYKDTFIK